jgi:hypothetical protein
MVTAPMMLVGLFALGCGRPPRAPSLTRNAPANGAYHSMYVESGEVKLVNGRAEVHDPEQTATVVLTDDAAFVDLDGDGRIDAAVVLVTSLGGTGSFYELAAVVDRASLPLHVASTDLGDRVKVESLRGDGRRVVLTVTTHRKEDPLGCPTLRVTKTYELQDSRLVEIGHRTLE